MKVGREILDDAVENLCVDKQNGKGEVVRVTSGTYRGKKHFDVRTFYTADEKLQPGKGAMLPTEFAVPVAVAILQSAGFDSDRLGEILSQELKGE